jgi:hypothetical protein
MDNRKNTAGESGPLNRLALVAVAVIAICATGAVILLAPAAATSGSSTVSAAPAAATPPTGYFPDQYVNQAREVEPMPEMYY